MSLLLIAACAPAVVAVPWFGLSRWGKVRRRRVEFAAASTPSGIVAGMACALILKEPERVDFGTKWEDRDRGIAVASTDSSLCSPAGQRFTGQTLKFRGERIDLDIHAQERIYRTMQEAVRINKERAKARARRENELRACDAIAAVMGTDPETVARNHGLLEGEAPRLPPAPEVRPELLGIVEVQPTQLEASCLMPDKIMMGPGRRLRREKVASLTIC